MTDTWNNICWLSICFSQNLTPSSDSQQSAKANAGRRDDSRKSANGTVAAAVAVPHQMETAFEFRTTDGSLIPIHQANRRDPDVHSILNYASADSDDDSMASETWLLTRIFINLSFRIFYGVFFYLYSDNLYGLNWLVSPPHFHGW